MLSLSLSFCMHRSIAPNRQWNFVEINVPYHEAMAHRQEIIDRMFPLDTVMDLVNISGVDRDAFVFVHV